MDSFVGYFLSLCWCAPSTKFETDSLKTNSSSLGLLNFPNEKKELFSFWLPCIFRVLILFFAKSNLIRINTCVSRAFALFFILYNLIYISLWGCECVCIFCVRLRISYNFPFCIGLIFIYNFPHLPKWWHIPVSAHVWRYLFDLPKCQPKQMKFW